MTQTSGRSASERRHHGLQVGLRQHRDVERRAREPLGAQADLRRRLLARDVERPPAGALQVAERHRRQRRLADARRAADQHQRAGHEPAAEHAVQLADRRSAGARAATALTVGQRHRLDRAPGRRACRGRPPWRARAPPRPACSTPRTPGTAPCHRGVSPPQAEQVKTVVARGHGSDDGRRRAGRVRPRPGRRQRAVPSAGGSAPQRHGLRGRGEPRWPPGARVVARVDRLCRGFLVPRAHPRGAARIGSDRTIRGAARPPRQPMPFGDAQPAAARRLPARSDGGAGAGAEHAHPDRLGEHGRLGQQLAGAGLVAARRRGRAASRPRPRACAPAMGGCPSARASPARPRSGARRAPTAPRTAARIPSRREAEPLQVAARPTTTLRPA